jgi:predicted transcriptional regulator
LAAARRDQAALNETRVLAVAVAAGASGLTPAQLADRAGLPARTARAVVARLVERGLVRREGKRRLWATRRGAEQAAVEPPAAMGGKAAPLGRSRSRHANDHRRAQAPAARPAEPPAPGQKIASTPVPDGGTPRPMMLPVEPKRGGVEGLIRLLCTPADRDQQQATPAAVARAASPASAAASIIPPSASDGQSEALPALLLMPLCPVCGQPHTANAGVCLACQAVSIGA